MGAQWPNGHASRFVEAGGQRWHVQIMGRGPALLMVHGIGAATHTWHELAPRLASRFTIIAPDLPGHGFTTAPRTDHLSLDGIAIALAALLEALKMAPVVGVGHGAGAAIAAQLICLHQAPAGSGLAPLLAGSVVSSGVLLGAVTTLHGRIDRRPPRWGLAIGSGALSALANLAFLLAVRSGDLSIVAVITALYPGATVVLARVVLSERLHLGQVVGLAAGALAVSLLAIG